MKGNMSKWKRRAEGGFTLLEVMVAAFVMGLAFTVLVRYVGRTKAAVARAEKITVATFLAREKMAETLLEIEKEYAQQNVFPEDREDRGEFKDPNDKFRWEVRIRKVALPAPEAGSADPNLIILKLVSDQVKELVREVKVSVVWDEGKKEKNVEVVTHIAKL